MLLVGIIVFVLGLEHDSCALVLIGILMMFGKICFC